MEGRPEFPAFHPRPPWWGGDLQTVRNYLFAPPPRLTGYASEETAFPMADGSGDVLLARLERPRGAGGRPLVVLVHGLTGCQDSAYVRGSARFFLGRGHAVLRLNLRGAGPSRGRCREGYHAGRSADLRAVFAALPAALVAGGVVAIGYSLGGNVLLKLLGEPAVAGCVRAAVAVSAPVDLAATSRRFARPRNRLYQRWLLARMKDEARAAPLDRRERAAVASARSVREFDDGFVAPRNGFDGADDYYARCSALPYLEAIAVPTLLVHAADDPWIPPEPYRDYNWCRAPACRLALSERGGHVGFHGRGSRIAWHDRCAARFVDGVYAAASRSAAASAK